MSGFSVPVSSWLYQGVVASSGLLHVYQTSTTTHVIIYADAALTAPLPNPVTLDANGQVKFFVNGAVNLRLDGYTSTGAFIASIDPVYPVSSSGVGTVVYQSTNLALSSNNAGNNIISTAPITITLPLTTTLNNAFSVQLNAQGGAITLTPNIVDKIQGGIAGANYVLAIGSSGLLWTDAAGNWGINFLSVPVVAPTQFGIGGVAKNLKIIASGATVVITADEVGLENVSNVYLIARTVNATINTATAAGLLAIDTGSWASNTWYYIWVISNGTLTSAIASLSSTTPTLPGAYTYKARIGAVRTSGTATVLLATLQYGRKAQYLVTGVSPNLAAPVVASGSAGNPATPTWVAVATGSYVPVTATGVVGSLSNAGATVVVAPNPNYGATGSTTNISYAWLGSGTGVLRYDMILESSNIYWASNTASGAITITGWEDNL